MKYIISIDIGGTTVNAGLFSEKLDLIDITSKDKIRNYKNKKEIIAAIFHQITFLIKSNRLNRDFVLFNPRIYSCNANMPNTQLSILYLFFFNFIFL